LDKQDIRLAVDIIVFGYQSNKLFVLLAKQKFGPFKDKWVLPGGFVLNDEGLLSAAKRELKEETGVALKTLNQLYTFGDDIKRDPRFRVVSVAYFGTANPTKMKLKASTDTKDANWFEITDLPKLPFDHSKIIDVAYTRLRGLLYYQPIGFDLLDAKFPFSALENLYMTILQRQIDRRNFRKKILSFDFLEETGEESKQGSGRPAALYRFNKVKYKQSIKDGIRFEIKFA